jgi:hypothetical protein
VNHCCLETVPQPDCSFETFVLPVADWQARLTAGLSRSVQASDQNLGHLEEEILRRTGELERKLLEEAAQLKADQTPPVCPACGHQLSRCTRDHPRTFQSRFGLVSVKRLRGGCRRCGQWRIPADHALGLSQTGGASPSVQDMAALTVSKMPVKEASAVIERLTGVKLPPATLDREARRQGQEAEKKRQHCPGRKRKRVGYFGAVRLRDGRSLFQKETGRFEGATFWPFLQRLRSVSAESGRTVMVITDNAKYHHAKLHAVWRQIASD